MHSFYEMMSFNFHTLELDCISHSDIQYIWLTQAAVIYGTFNGLQLQSVIIVVVGQLISHGKTLAQSL